MDELEYNTMKLTIESILFYSSKNVPIKEIHALFPNNSLNYIQNLLEELIYEYQNRNSAFEIMHNSDDSYILKIRQHLLNHPKVRVFMHKKQFNAKMTEVIAFIALNQPITIPDMVEFLGKKILPIVQYLEQQFFIQKDPQTTETESEKNPVPYVTTALFADYMGVPNNVDVIKQTIQIEFENQKQKNERKIQRKQNSIVKAQSEEISETEIHSAAAKFDAIY